MQKRVNVITLGCSKNLSDSEVLLGQLNHAGLAAASEMRDDHDIVVVNTCGFIDLAKEESVETILHQVKHRIDLLGARYPLAALSRQDRKTARNIENEGGNVLWVVF